MSEIGRRLARAFAHNDYAQQRPLLDALAHGFAAIEADIHLVDGELLVGHGKRDLVPGRTLATTYLEPLVDRPARIERRVETVEVTLASGRRVRAGLLAAADGRGSPLRDLAGIGVMRWRYDQTGIVAPIAALVWPSPT